LSDIHNKRLLNIAKALREDPDPDDFCMSSFTNQCGTPACALGHYADRRDLQDAFSLSKEGYLTVLEDGLVVEEIRYVTDFPITDHFNLSDEEADELFEIEGCGNAQTNIEAAEYIERFVERRKHRPALYSE
jgi:hypothetical protein